MRPAVFLRDALKAASRTLIEQHAMRSFEAESGLRHVHLDNGDHLTFKAHQDFTLDEQRDGSSVPDAAGHVWLVRFVIERKIYRPLKLRDL